MTSVFRTHVAVAVLGSLLVVAGCNDVEKQKAIADANEARADANAVRATLTKAQADLTKAQADLTATQKERDDAKATIGTLTTSLDGVKSQLTTITKARDELQKVADSIPAMKEQLAQLTKDKLAAVAKAADAEKVVGDLKTQLQGLEKKVTDLQDTNTKLQAALDELKKKISSVTIPGVTPQ